MSKTIITLTFASLLFISKPVLANGNRYFGKKEKFTLFGNSDKKGSNFSVNKFGSILGIQRGNYFNIELGIEQQKKQLKLINPNTIAWAFNMEYAWKTNTLGFKLGSWFKTGRLGFTYGLNTLGTSNFDKFNIGIAPALGFKIIGFHLITSYNFFIAPENYDYNKMHLSIRYFISRKRKFVKN